METPLRPILELETAELHALVQELREWVPGELPAVEAVENEDWGRDYLLQRLEQVPPEELARRGLAWD